MTHTTVAENSTTAEKVLVLPTPHRSSENNYSEYHKDIQTATNIIDFIKRRFSDLRYPSIRQ